MKFKDLYKKYNPFHLEKEFKEDSVILESQINIKPLELLKEKPKSDALHIELKATKRF